MKPETLLGQMKPFEVSDRAKLLPYFEKYPQEICEMSFNTMLLWGESRDHRWIELDGHLITCMQKKGDVRRFYPPIGSDPPRIIRDVLPISEGYKWFYLGQDIADKLNDLPIKEERDRFDYIYDLPSLRSLAGGKYSEKRNFIKRCKAAGAESFLIDASHAAECQAMLEGWMAEHPGPEMESSLDEISSLAIAFKNFDQLGMIGVGVRVNNKLEAFAIGSELNKTMFLEHFEKSTNKYPGLYAFIFHEFAKAVPEQYIDLNKEEDLGLPGLRTAKERWHPKALISKVSLES